MKVSRLLLVAAFTSACGDAVATQRATPPIATPAEVAIQEGERKTSTDPAVNPNAAAMAEFKARVDKYADLHKQLAKGAATQKETSDPRRSTLQRRRWRRRFRRRVPMRNRVTSSPRQFAPSSVVSSRRS